MKHASLGLLFAVALLVGCSTKDRDYDDRGPMARMGESTEDATDELSQDLEQAGDNFEDATDDWEEEENL